MRNDIEDEVEAGIDVLKAEFVLTRTERPGSDYYSLVRMDSQDVKKLTAEEELELDGAKTLDLHTILGGSKDSKMALED